MTPLRRHSITFLATIAVLALALPAFAQSTPAPATGGTSVTGQINAGLSTAAAGYGNPIPLPQLIGSLIGVALTLLGVLLLCYLLYGGFTWMTAGGDESKVKKARALITNAIIGLVIVVAAYSIASFILTSLTTVTTGVGGGTPVTQ
ncbi:MAG: hypothetical protein WA001_05695 [Patescibacteria group bacterium]